jgi:drug/metabolite transporter (DMT)-like permease
MLVGWWLYDEAISLPLMVGAILIIAANAVGLYMERSRVKRRLSGLD